MKFLAIMTILLLSVPSAFSAGNIKLYADLEFSDKSVQKKAITLPECVSGEVLVNNSGSWFCGKITRILNGIATCIGSICSVSSCASGYSDSGNGLCVQPAQPVQPITASTVASVADATAHVHTVTIPFTDISVAPASDLYQFRSAVSNGHSHVIALSKQQMIDLNNGMRLALTSSTPADTGASHTHSWTILGGSVLYEKNCYNCHSNDKRNHSPMNVAFNSSQTMAVINPGNALLSTSTAATPDPNYASSSIVTLDGSALYAANCAATTCHGPLATSSKQNRTFNQIKTAISDNRGGMASLGGLTDAQLQAIATALIK